MEQQIREALKQAFPGSQLDLDRAPDGRYSGLLTWDGFEDQDSIERHQKVRQALVDVLNDDAANVGMLFTYTSKEITAMRAA